MTTSEDRFEAIDAWTKFVEALDPDRVAPPTFIESHPSPDRALHWFFIWLMLDDAQGARRAALGTSMLAAVEMTALASWRALCGRDPDVYRSLAQAVIDADTGSENVYWIRMAVEQALAGNAMTTSWAVRSCAQLGVNPTFGTPFKQNERAALMGAAKRAHRAAAQAILNETVDDGPWIDALASTDDEVGTAAIFADWLAERHDPRAPLMREIIRISPRHAPR